MELYYLFVIISVIISAKSEAFVLNTDDTTVKSQKSLNIIKRDVGRDCNKDGVILQTYALYLIGFTMVIMLMIIICLAVALYLIIKKRKAYGLTINNNKQYVRQESTGIATMYNSNYDEHNKHNGSTLTMNSGIIEINRVSDPETPTRIEDSRITYIKRPIRPIVPIIHKGQMDEICKEVLRKVQKSDSASYRDLNELLNWKGEEKFGAKCEPVNESEKEEKMFDKKERKPETQQETKQESKHEPKQESKLEPKVESIYELNAKGKINNETENDVKHVQNNNDVKIEVKDVDGDMGIEDSDTETEYDTVPNPVRFRHSGPESEDFDVDSIPVYDLPPRRSFEGTSRNLIQLDQNTQYLLPLSAGKTDSCYINAKRNSYSST